MKRVVAICAAIGFSVPIFWGIVSFITFGGAESPAADFYWQIVHVTCPPWMTPQSSPFGSTLITPFLNAVIYGCVAFVVYGPIKLFMRKQSAD